MNKRIKAIASYIDEKDKVIDIGCDQALLGEYLAKKNIYSIASDIKKSIVESAQNRITSLNLNKFVKFIVADGLKDTELEDYDTIVLAGMGTYTILEILRTNKKKIKKIITISNNNHEILRYEMLLLGYSIKFEEIVYDKGKYYNLIVFIPGKTKYNFEQMTLGKNHVNLELFYKKINIDLKKYKIIYDKSKDEYIKKKIILIEKKLKCH